VQGICISVNSVVKATDTSYTFRNSSESFNRENSKKKTEGKNVKSKEILAFGLIDKNKDESISKHEMSNMFQNMTKEQVAALFKKIDRDGNGKIDWKEFKKMYS